MPYMTIRDHRAQNKHLKDDVSESEFVARRREHDTAYYVQDCLSQGSYSGTFALAGLLSRLPVPGIIAC